MKVTPGRKVSYIFSSRISLFKLAFLFITLLLLTQSAPIDFKKGHFKHRYTNVVKGKSKANDYFLINSLKIN